MTHPAQKYIDLKAKNLEFLKQNYPGIYEYFGDYELQRAKIDILPDAHEVDLIINDKHLYGGQSLSFAKREVATFLAAFDYGSKVKSFQPLGRDTYKNQRFFAKSLSELYQAYYKESRVFNGYELRDFFPLMVFMGVGLGRHIEIMCKVRDIHHAVVFERDMDRFAASLYTVDWREICTPFLKDESRSFAFVLSPTAENETQLFASVWNHLLALCPMFPTTTLFYNHMGDRIHDSIANRVNSDLYVHLFSFGNVDDELNQLNNALHNFKSGVKLFRKPGQSLPVPVCIVGSGPSLDERIEDLRALQDKAIIISSGTALRALLKHGIKPDFQVELESDFNTFAAQNMTEEKDVMKSVNLLGAAQLNPLVFDLFGEARLFLKDDGALADWFGDDGDAVENATPTCTNAALALAFHLNVGQLFLFGLDYGFRDPTQHHSNGAVYYSDAFSKEYKFFNDNDLMVVPGADGCKIYTTPFFFTAKRRIDNLLYGKSAQIFNCSNGSQLDHTTWVKAGEVEGKLLAGMLDKSAALEMIFGGSDQAMDRQILEQRVNAIQKALKKQIANYLTWIDEYQMHDVKDFTRFCSLFYAHFAQMKHNNKGLYFFIRGSIWHFLLAGFTHVYSLSSGDQVREYLVVWVCQFRKFLRCFLVEVDLVCRLGRDVAKDDRVHKTISAPFEGMASTEPELCDLLWEFTGLTVDGSGVYHEFIA